MYAYRQKQMIYLKRKKGTSLVKLVISGPFPQSVASQKKKQKQNSLISSFSASPITSTTTQNGNFSAAAGNSLGKKIITIMMMMVFPVFSLLGGDGCIDTMCVHFLYTYFSENKKEEEDCGVMKRCRRGWRPQECTKNRFFGGVCRKKMEGTTARASAAAAESSRSSGADNDTVVR